MPRADSVVKVVSLPHRWAVDECHAYEYYLHHDFVGRKGVVKKVLEPSCCGGFKFVVEFPYFRNCLPRELRHLEGTMARVSAGFRPENLEVVEK